VKYTIGWSVSFRFLMRGGWVLFSCSRLQIRHSVVWCEPRCKGHLGGRRDFCEASRFPSGRGLAQAGHPHLRFFNYLFHRCLDSLAQMALELCFFHEVLSHFLDTGLGFRESIFSFVKVLFHFCYKRFNRFTQFLKIFTVDHQGLLFDMAQILLNCLQSGL